MNINKRIGGLLLSWGLSSRDDVGHDIRKLIKEVVEECIGEDEEIKVEITGHRMIPAHGVPFAGERNDLRQQQRNKLKEVTE